jgi:hypothetical protein
MSVVIKVLRTPAPKGSARSMLNRKTGKPFTFHGGSPVAEVKLDTWDGAVRAAAAPAAVHRLPPRSAPIARSVTGAAMLGSSP